MRKLKLLIGLILLGVYSCSETYDPNRLDSDTYNTKEERVEVLKKEIKSYSEFENAEFELFNANGFLHSRITVPGASSWNYKFAIKVNPSDIDKWTHDMILTDSVDYDDSWMRKLVQKRTTVWRVDSEPEFYTRKGDGIVIVFYRPEGILFKRIVNL
jgi:hypothetical protein